MRKIPSLFVRDWNGNPEFVTREVDPECAWVAAGEGVATRKRDGSAVMVRAGLLYARYDCKAGKTPPTGFESCGELDLKTGHCPGWVPADRLEDMWLREAFRSAEYEDGTYEVCGPKIGGNTELLPEHVLFRHGAELLVTVPRDYDGIKAWLAVNVVEGVVWHWPQADGGVKMAKIKRRDFGIPWGAQKVRRRLCL